MSLSLSLDPHHVFVFVFWLLTQIMSLSLSFSFDPHHVFVFLFWLLTQIMSPVTWIIYQRETRGRQRSISLGRWKTTRVRTRRKQRGINSEKFSKWKLETFSINPCPGCFPLHVANFETKIFLCMFGMVLWPGLCRDKGPFSKFSIISKISLYFDGDAMRWQKVGEGNAFA